MRHRSWTPFGLLALLCGALLLGPAGLSGAGDQEADADKAPGRQLARSAVKAPGARWTTADHSKSFVEKNYDASQLIYFDTVQQCLEAVSDGQADITFTKAITAQEDILKGNYYDLVTNGNVVFAHKVAMVRQRWPARPLREVPPIWRWPCSARLWNFARQVSRSQS